jgi:hypothetical protein
LAVGAVQLTVAVPSASCNTEIENAGSETCALPSLTVIWMLANVAMSSRPGVPESLPLVVLNEAQAGLLAIEKVSGSPSASVALGWKVYAMPIMSDRSGEPDIVGARFAGAVTWIVNEGSETVASASEMEIVMRAEVPTSAAPGVPVRRPVEVLNVAQAGLFCIDQVRVLPSGSLPTGRKL